ncbi:MAG TPA: branched-chain amino acid ABC transporter ATP-binding protein/permease [Burkholderiaceae bacterium]|nr:branched-chain amino acid ABC transporter ATP-binding protein/permease [Burkholderiaceae bacterium]
MTKLSPLKIAAGAGVVALLALPLLPVPEFWITQLDYIGLYTTVVLGLVLLTGVAGLTSFGQAAFVGLGAYATAYVTTAHGVSPWLGLVCGLALTLVVALVVAGVTLRMSGHYLPLATIAWGLALFFLVGNLDFLGKFDGIQGIPPVAVGGVELRSGRASYGLIWIVALLGALALRHLLDSRPGRAIRALKGGTLMAEAMGVDTLRYKVTAFVIAAIYASLSGWLFAHYQRSVNPSPFGLQMGIEYLFMAVLGGVGLVGGAFVGAAAVKVAEDQLQNWLPALLGTSGPVELVVFGMVLILVLQVTPQGLWSLVTRRLPVRRLDPSAWAGAEPLPRAAPPARGETVLSVQKARKQFGGLVAVNDVGFDVRAGEIVGLIGPNGAGKSTLFNLITGVLPLTSGQVDFRGARVSGLSSRAIARRGMSRTFQHVRMIPDMSVLENVALGAHRRAGAGVLRAMLRLDRREERRLLAEAWKQLDRIGMASLASEPAGNLALGQQRLMEIARALCTDPALLLLDEPAAGLRLKEKQALGEVLSQLRAEGMSLLLVEHDMDFVMTLTDRIVVVEFGTKLTEGTPDQVREDPAVRAAYLGVEH